MWEKHETFKRWQETSTALRTKAVDLAVHKYFTALGKSDCPGPADIEAAKCAAEEALAKELLSRDWMLALKDASKQNVEWDASQTLCFNTMRSKLRLPSPQIRSELSAIHLGLAAVVGAVGGMLVLTPVMRLLLGMRDTGLFIGAPAGAFLLVFAVWHSARSKWVRWALTFGSVAMIVSKVWGMLKGKGIFGGAWSAIRQIPPYAAAAFVLLLAKPRCMFDRRQHEELIREAIEQWLDGAIITLLWITTNEEASAAADSESVFFALVQKIMALRRVSTDQLSVARDELCDELLNHGFEMALESSNMLWCEEHQGKYDVFGHVEQGDKVVIEREPVVFQGTVCKKGLVRKLRGGV